MSESENVRVGYQPIQNVIQRAMLKIISIPLDFIMMSLRANAGTGYKSIFPPDTSMTFCEQPLELDIQYPPIDSRMPSREPMMKPAIAQVFHLPESKC
jgi:hypothetical protein